MRERSKSHSQEEAACSNRSDESTFSLPLSQTSASCRVCFPTSPSSTSFPRSTSRLLLPLLFLLLFSLSPPSLSLARAQSVGPVFPSSSPTHHYFSAPRSNNTIALKATKTNRRYYFARISVGSDAKPFNAAIDLSSDLTWVSCDCVQCSSGVPKDFKGKNSYLRSSSSKSATNIDCLACQHTLSGLSPTSVGCTNSSTSDFRLSFPSSVRKTFSKSECHYFRNYQFSGFENAGGVGLDAYGSSRGKVFFDVFNASTKGKQPLLQMILLGCAQFQEGIFDNASVAADGVLGLASGFLSLPSQISNTSSLSSSSFSICLSGNQTSSDGGYIAFGFNFLPKEVRNDTSALTWQKTVLTTFNQTGLPFFVNVVAISFNGVQLPVPSSAFPSSLSFNTSSQNFTFSSSSSTSPSFLTLSVTNANTLISNFAPYSLIPDVAFLEFARALSSAFPQLKLIPASTSSSLSGTDGLDCLDASAYKTADESSFLSQFPMAALHMSDGAAFLLPPSIYLKTIDFSKGVVCFTALQQGSSPYLVLGEHWLREKFFLFNANKSSLQWFDADCLGNRFLKYKATLPNITTILASPSPPPPPPAFAPAPLPSPQSGFNSTWNSNNTNTNNGTNVNGSNSTSPGIGAGNGTSNATAPGPAYSPGAGGNLYNNSISPPGGGIPSNFSQVPDNLNSNNSDTSNNVNCTIDPNMCAFYFQGFKDKIPRFNIGSAQGDMPISPPIESNVLGVTLGVNVANSGSGTVLCSRTQTFSNGTQVSQQMNGGSSSANVTPDMISSQFYTSGPVVMTRTFQQYPGKQIFAQQVIVLNLTNAQIDVFGLLVNLNPGDNNSYFPENKRCVIFQTTIEDGSGNGGGTSPTPPPA